MDLASAGLKEQPFRTHGRPLTVVPYAAHRSAVEALLTARALPLPII
jgi:hypothetical protein